MGISYWFFYSIYKNKVLRYVENSIIIISLARKVSIFSTYFHWSYSMSTLIISPLSLAVNDLVAFISAMNCAQMEINEFASIETIKKGQLDVVFEDLTEKQREKVLAMFTLNNAKYTYEEN